MAYDGEERAASAGSTGSGANPFAGGHSEHVGRTRQNIFGVDAGIVRGQHWRDIPPAVATMDACEQTFAWLSWALRYYCVPCWDAFRELDEDAEYACA